ncbi:MAG: diacylglycerol kinase family protein [Oligoflexia bacterium]|nr:diacylglycerol kinase family protein [Oligoflexia bacterium]
MSYYTSFRYAASGIWELVRNHANVRLMGIATLGVMAAGLYLNLAAADWCLLVLVTALVWVAEGFNTALECLCNKVCTEQDPLIKKSKDTAAGAVLLAVIASVVVGILVFYRYALG